MARAAILAWLGRSDEELRALDQCLEVVPGALDCVASRSVVMRRLGRCDEAAAEARHWVSLDPHAAPAYRELAAALVSKEASPDAIQEALSLEWRYVPDEEREVTSLSDRLQLAMWRGDFTGALRTADDLRHRAIESVAASIRLRATIASVDALVEIGRGAEAAAVAAAAGVANPHLLAVELEHGNLSFSKWTESSESWERANPLRLDAFELWLFRWGPAVGGRILAADALLHDPRTEAGSIARFATRDDTVGVHDAYEGRIHLYAGRPAKAATYLERATRSCQGLESAALRVHAHLWLGQAKEQLGDVPAACHAYRFVLRRWREATPPSVTAQEAERRMRALGCLLKAAK